MMQSFPILPFFGCCICLFGLHVCTMGTHTHTCSSNNMVSSLIGITTATTTTVTL
jgi:hypothetical protein